VIETIITQGNYLSKYGIFFWKECKNHEIFRKEYNNSRISGDNIITKVCGVNITIVSGRNITIASGKLSIKFFWYKYKNTSRFPK